METGLGTRLVGSPSAPAVRGRSVNRADFQSRSRDDSQSLPASQESAPRLGFGEGTVSSLGVAATTVNRNLESVREIVPSLEELSAEARERASASRERAAEVEEARANQVSEESLRNERAARAQVEFFNEDTETPDSQSIEPSVERPEFFGANARAVTSVVVPEPESSFDVFG